MLLRTLVAGANDRFDIAADVEVAFDLDLETAILRLLVAAHAETSLVADEGLSAGAGAATTLT